MSDNTTSKTWAHRWTFILAATGSAVGLGNIWKFPYITGENGGGAFVLVYLACILLVGVPLMMAEVMLGKAGRNDPITTTRELAQRSNASPAWSFIGIMGVCTGLFILMFYSVVAGWVLDYVIQSASGHYIGSDAETIAANFSALRSNTLLQFSWHTLFVAVTAGVVAAGVTKGIGNAVEILMPLLFVLLLILLGYSIAVGDFAAALSFLFQPDFSKLTRDAILTALGHAFFTLSLGMGAIMAYGSYIPERASITKTVLTVATLDTLIALVAGMAIFPLVFANNLQADSGPGLMFQTLPLVFSQMTGGVVFGTIFFALVSIAALSSSISLIEPGVAWLEKRGVRRLWATFGLASCGWVGGLFCILQGDFFNLLDELTANIMLPLGGLLIALFTGWVMVRSDIRAALTLHNDHLYHLWYALVRVVAPIAILIIFANSVGLI